MTMADLIKSLGDYINVGKRVVNTVPGLLMAFAFVLLLSSPPDYFKSRFLANNVTEAEKRLADARRELNDLTQQQAVANGDQTFTNDRLAEFKAGFCPAGKSPPCPVPEDKRGVWRELQADAAAASGKSSVIQNRVNAKSDEVKTLQKELDGWTTRVHDSADFSKFLNSGVTGWLLFGLLGMAIGTVLDPLNKALFLQWLPGLSGDRNLPPFVANLVRPARGGGKTEKLDKPIQFFIGSGVITQQEYDGLVSDYYRWSEISVGMILPVLAITAGWFRQWELSHGAWPDITIAVVILVLALLLAVVLFTVGLRRYREFQQQVNTFVHGRMKLQQEQLTAQKQHVDLTNLAQLIYEAKIAADKLRAR